MNACYGKVPWSYEQKIFLQEEYSKNLKLKLNYCRKKPYQHHILLLLLLFYCRFFWGLIFKHNLILPEIELNLHLNSLVYFLNYFCFLLVNDLYLNFCPRSISNFHYEFCLQLMFLFIQEIAQR